MGRLAYTIRQAAHVSGRPQRVIIEAIKGRELAVRRRDDQPVITRLDLQAWVNEFPSYDR